MKGLDIGGSPPRPLRRGALIDALAVALVLAGATGAAGQSQPPPSSTRPPTAPITLEPLANVIPTALKAATPDSITFLLTKAPVAGAPATWNVDFREEETQADYATRIGGASAAGAATVDCGRRQFRLGSFTLFSTSNLRGQTMLQLHARSQWENPVANTLIWRVVDLTCTEAKHDIEPSPTGRTQVVSSVPNVAKPAAVVAQEQRQPGAAASAPATTPPAPAPATPIRLRGAQQSEYWVQIGALDSAASAQDLLTRLDGEGLLHGQGHEVREARVNGVKVFRGLVGAFPSRSAAAQFCQSLMSRGRPCFVRND